MAAMISIAYGDERFLCGTMAEIMASLDRFKTEYIVGVVVTDKEPCSHTVASEIAWSWSNDRGMFHTRNCIPAAIWERLDGVRGLDFVADQYFPTRDRAWQAFSDAIVAFGREQAGLPPLVWPSR